MGMHHTTLLVSLVLLVPALTGCIAGEAEEGTTLDALSAGSFTVGGFVQDLERQTGVSLVNARVAGLQIEFNQTRATLVEWRSFASQGERCELVSTMTYEGRDGPGGFLVHKEDQPCPLSLYGRPSVAEVVALVDRVSLRMVQDQVLEKAQLFSVELAGYCAYAEGEEGTTSVFVWDGRGLAGTVGDVRCGGGQYAALTLAVAVPDGAGAPGRSAHQSYIILEQVPAL